tara:strand:+ start:207 stop:437 length:231 start_codon:yes stop_codon:yes gene_type:complete
MNNYSEALEELRKKDVVQYAYAISALMYGIQEMKNSSERLYEEAIKLKSNGEIPIVDPEYARSSINSVVELFEGLT